jgi:hypothetical protein
MLAYNIALPGGVGLNDPAADARAQSNKVPAAVDVSGMEAAFSIGAARASSTSDFLSLGIEDAGSTGTGSTDLHTAVGGSGDPWVANTVKAAEMSTSAANLDADDLVGVSWDENGTVTPLTISALINYVYGIPGGIN